MKQRYTCQVLEGSARQVGQTQAKYLAEHKPDAMRFYSEPFEGNAARLAEGEKLLEMNERWCPGLNEEIEGFAAELGARPEAIVYYTGSIPRTGNCSQFAVLPDLSATGTTLCARSYEWSCEDDFTLSTVRIPGRAAHTGFTCMLFGRLDGLNDRGLWVSMTMGNPTPGEPLPSNAGFRFWSLVRTILDRAGSVEEAIDIATPFPMAFYPTLLVADRAGHAALIEKSPDATAVKRVTNGFIHSTNHYTLPKTRPINKVVFAHSSKRYDFLASRLRQGKQSPDSIKAILSGSFPNGLACHFYREYFGTLWSTWADLSRGELNVCMGATDVEENAFRTFRPDDPAGIRWFEAELPDEMAAPGMWDREPNPFRA
jgi:predicted choloylglycine hydrolase